MEELSGVGVGGVSGGGAGAEVVGTETNDYTTLIQSVGTLSDRTTGHFTAFVRPYVLYLGWRNTDLYPARSKRAFSASHNVRSIVCVKYLNLKKYI